MSCAAGSLALVGGLWGGDCRFLNSRKGKLASFVILVIAVITVHISQSFAAQSQLVTIWWR